MARRTRAELDELRNVREAMSTPAGRYFAMMVLRAAGYDATLQVAASAFDPDNAQRTAFYLGQQDVGSYLIRRLIEACPASIGLMQRESGANEIIPDVVGVDGPVSDDGGE